MQKHTNLTNEIDHFPPKTDWLDILMIMTVGLAIGCLFIEYVYGADRLIYQIAGLFS